MADEHSAVRSLYHKVRFYALAGLVVLSLIVILQNLDQVATEVLFWNFRMPQAVLLLATLLAGFAGGVLWTGYRHRR